MRFFLTLCIFVFTTFAVWASPPLKQVTTWYDKEKTEVKEVYFIKEIKGAQTYDSTFTSYYQSGKIKSQGQYLNNNLDGKWKFYYESGSIKAKGFYKDSQADSLWMYYYENGTVSSKGELLKGKKVGNWQFFYENGSKKSSGYYVFDNAIGKWLYFYDNGSVKGKANYTSPGYATYEEFDGNGITKAKGFLKNGLSDSSWVHYYPGGKVRARGKELNGHKSGHWEYFYENGKTSAVGDELNGQREGKWLIFDDNGFVTAEGNYVNGSGDYKEYYPNGKIKAEGKIENGKNQGAWIFYDADGKVEGKANFDEGEGLYQGFFQNGNLKMEGPIKDNNKAGRWKLYNADGTFAGYYQNYPDDGSIANLEHQIEVDIDSAHASVVTKEDLKPVKSNTKDKRKKQSNIKYFSVILSLNPFAVFVNSLPIYLELYNDKKWGYELEGIIMKNPLFQNHTKLGDRQVGYYETALGVKQKIYQKKATEIGRPYFAHGFRYVYLAAKSNLHENIGDPQVTVLQVNQNSFEYTLQIGDRLLKNYRKSGIAFDIYGGLGLGYRFYGKNWSSNAGYDEVFSEILQSNWYMPLRFGFSLGYRF